MKKIVLALLIALTACGETQKLASQDASETSTINYYNRYISQIELPDKLDFCGEEVPMDIPEVRERVEREFYLNLQWPGQIMLYLKRSGRYFPMFERVIKEHGMPDDLKYLSVAESALYMSRSSKGALGLWQFMSSTGKSMGLRIDDYVDERRHPEKSTYAAMKYLLQGYDNTRSWTLAAAGYNMGHTGLINRVKRQSADDYYDLFLNDETSRYILRIIVIKEIMSNPAKYGFILEDDDYYKPYKTKTIEVKTSVTDLVDWAEERGTTYKYVRLLNPWILGKSLLYPGSGKTWEIEIPEE